MSTVSLDSLSWIKTELERTLETARQRLDAYAEDPKHQPELLDEFVERIHQVVGTLTMVEVNGGRMLAEHMQQLGQAVRDGRIGPERETLEPLMRGSLELTDYLDRMVSGMRDSPAVLLPITNEIRARLGRTPIARERVGRPAPAVPQAVPGAESTASLAARMRPAYQAALLKFYQGAGEDEAIARMRDVVTELESAATTPPVFEFLWVVSGVLEALADGGLPPTLGTKRLLGQVERELKRLATSSEAAMADEPPEVLVEQLLGEVERAGSSGERVNAIRTAFRLGETGEAEDSAAGGAASGPGGALLRSVGSAILEDLGRVRDRIDIFVRTGRTNPEELAPLADTLKKVADALGMLGLAEPRARVVREREAVEELAGGTQSDETSLLRLATELIGIESDVEAYLVGSGDDPRTAALRGARVAGLREVLADISRIKEAITEAVRNPHDPVRLDDLPRLADLLGRALDFLGVSDVAPLMRRIAHYLVPLSRSGRLPERSELDRLADAVVSVEYYVETLQRGRTPPASMLENADRALMALGIREGEVPEGPIGGAPERSSRGGGETAAADTKLEAQGTESAEAAAEPEASDAVPAPAPGDAGEEPRDTGSKRSSSAPPLPVSKAPPAGEIELPPVREEGADQEIVEVFIEEAAEVCETLDEALPRWLNNPDDREALTTVRRSFHTLKGSGRMVGAARLGEFAWGFENLLNRVIDHTLPPAEVIVTAVSDAVAAVPQLLAQFQDGREPEADVAELLGRAWRLARSEPSALDAEVREQAAEAPAGQRGDGEFESGGPAEAPLHGGGIPGETEGSAEVEAPAEQSADSAAPEDHGDGEAAAAGPRIDPALYDVYRRETEAHLGAIRAWLDSVASGGWPDVSFELRRAAHTVCGSARMAGVTEMDELFAPLDRLLKAAEQDGAAVGWLVPEMSDAVGVGEELLRAYGDAGLPLPEWQPVRDRLEDRAGDYGDRGEDSLETQAYTESLLGDEFADETPEETGVAGGETREEEELPPLEFPGEDGEAAGESESPAARDEPLDAEAPAEPDAPADAETPEETLDADVEVPAEPPPERPAVPPAAPGRVVELRGLDEYDPELAGVFVGEAYELLEGADASVTAWSENHDLTEPLTELLRRLHTLKGGARMAGVIPLADLSHELESLLVRVADGRVAVSGELLRLVERSCDRLHRMLEHAAGDGRIPLDDAVVVELRRYTGGDLEEYLEGDIAGADEDSGQAEAPAANDAETTAEAETPDSAETTESVDEKPLEGAADGSGPDRRTTPRLRHEMARVRADLLENSINNAGELSIYRSRVEQQLLNMNLHLTELDRTVDRVRTQLRELDMETEAQILADHRADNAAPGFDPLEFDRYTRIHELSRSLAEAVSDLTSLRSLLATELRQGSVLLERQGRVNVDLQDALMRTRMVPFTLSAARLRRVVRQIAEETGKDAALRLHGVEGEMDRQVLEHILPALEHLLRNAVVHGIEDADTRRNRGKPETGHIDLTLRREGNDVVIEVADDGGGLDLKAIRAKAEAEDIIGPEAELSDREVAELIFRPGFSTADTLTQAAGRGVGMDVVAAEARQVGGRTEIDTRAFEGTRCVMRLPVTLAITQTLLIRVGRTRYPVPLSSIGAVQRLSRAQLDELLENEEPMLEYAGEAYEIVSLSGLLGEEAPAAEDEAPRVPLLLVNSGGRRIALMADDMEGSSEVVVKSVGPQIGHVPGIAGATIFGDGSIGLLLDLSALVRAMPEADVGGETAAAATSQAPVRETLVMIVDDSITVRRVTQRLLERRGARVLAAKDGVEALELLQDHTPDILLLDIEMPRMDGYELAGHMKNDPHMRDIPIIVITSRTGDKHRARAGQIGIERYLGKPYQEAELLEAIQSVVGGLDPSGTFTALESRADLD